MKKDINNHTMIIKMTENNILSVLLLSLNAY
jgi:hypothetical protein